MLSCRTGVTGLRFVQILHPFDPTGFSSNFINRHDLTAWTSKGHVHPLSPVPLIGAASVIWLLLFAIVGFPLQRMFTGRWCPEKRKMRGALVLAFSLTGRSFSPQGLQRVDFRRSLRRQIAGQKCHCSQQERE